MRLSFPTTVESFLEQLRRAHLKDAVALKPRRHALFWPCPWHASQAGRSDSHRKRRLAEGAGHEQAALAVHIPGGRGGGCQGTLQQVQLPESII